MALVLKDRVKEATITTGTGTITLAGASTGYQSFSVIGNANTTYYCIAGQGTTEWEVGIGTYTASGTTLSRDTILASSNSGSAVNFSAGTKDVFVVYPAGKSVNQDASGVTTISSLVATTADINGGTVDNTSIGATTPSTGAFTTLSATGLITKTNAAATPSQFLSVSGSTTAQTFGQITNTGGNLVFGIESSVGGQLISGDAAYSSAIYTANATNLYIGINNAAVAAFSSTGLAVTGALSSTSTYTQSAVSNIAIDSTSSAASCLIRVKGSTGDQWQFGSGHVLAGDWGIYNVTDTRQDFLISGSGAITMPGGGGLAVTGTLSATGEITAGINGGNNGITFTQNWRIRRENATTGNLWFEESGAAKMVIDTSGNVGIGTSSPGYKLDAFGSMRGQVQSGATNNTAPIALIASNKTTGAHAAGLGASLQFEYANSGGGYAGGQISSVAGADPFTADLRFYPRNYGYTEAMRIDSSGNVGIGTTSPAGKLQVEASDSRIIVGYSGSDNYYDGAFHIFRGSLAGGVPERMRLDASGNLLLGTTSNNVNARLFVDSTINTNYAGQFAMRYNVSGQTNAYYKGITGTQIGLSQTARGLAIFNYDQDSNQGINFYPAAYPGMTSPPDPSARIDSSGNVGIGASSITNWGGYRTLQIGTSDSVLGHLALYNSTGRAAFVAGNTASAAFGSGINIPVVFEVNSSERMRIDSSGNVGIGTSSPGVKLDIAGANNAINETITNSSGANYIKVTNGTGNAYFGIAGNNTTAILSISATPIVFGTDGGTERMRIDSSGNLLVGQTSGGSGRLRVSGSGDAFNAPYASPSAAYFWSSNSGDSNCVEIYQGRYNKVGLTMSNNNTGTVTQIDFVQTGTSRGSITTDNSTTAYNTSSDYRLKNTIAPMTGALAKVAALKPVTYKWNADGSDGEGFIAHELAEVCPQAVTGEKDAVDDEGKPVYQGIDTSFLVATLTAAIKEQQTIIESLTARIAALEAQ